MSLKTIHLCLECLREVRSEKALAIHSSTLAWKIPWIKEPGRLQSMGLLRESDTTGWLHFHALEKEMVAHSSALAWRILAMEEPGGLPSLGSHRVGHNWSDLAAAADVCYRIQALGHWASLMRISVNVYRQRVQYTGSELAQIPNILTLSLQNVSLKKMKRLMHPTRTYYIPISQLGISTKVWHVPVQPYFPNWRWHQEENVLRHKIIIHA